MLRLKLVNIYPLSRVLDTEKRYC